MLNISPPSPIPSSPGIRRRGGQPSNRNALKHGFFAVHNLTPFTPLLDPVQPGTPQPQAVPLSNATDSRPAAQAGQLHPSFGEWPAERLGPLLAQAIQSVRQQIALTFDAASHATGFKSILTWQRALLRHLALFIRYRKALARHQQSQFQLELCASHTLALIRRDLHEKGLPIQKYSFRGKPELRYFNSFVSQVDAPSPQSAPPQPFLTASQWSLLEPILPAQKLPSPVGEGPGERSFRGRPPSNPRPLLDAIFWKIAQHARWLDLPAGSPPMLTCRRYYRRLCLTGRLYPLYSALYHDFLAHSGTDLPTLVARATFSLSGAYLVLSPTAPDTWQTRTALLLMQLAYQSSRRLLQKTTSKTPSLFPSFDFRNLQDSNSPRMNSDEP